jgi:putative two-component system response regulator
VLLKPARLTPEEFQVMQQHTVIGDRLCGELRSLRRVRPIVRHHHERLDGSGYPDRLRGSAVPLLAQIMGVVDVFDALTSVRPYKRALTTAEAYEELTREIQLGWRDKDLVDALVGLDLAGGAQAGNGRRPDAAATLGEQPFERDDRIPSDSAR